jgi:hypothetical protein
VRVGGGFGVRLRSLLGSGLVLAGLSQGRQDKRNRGAEKVKEDEKEGQKSTNSIGSRKG